MIALLQLTFFLLSIFCVFSVNIPPEDFWPSGLAIQLIPIVVCINVILFLFNLIKKNFFAALQIIVLVACFPLLGSTYQFSKKNQGINLDEVSILSYNTSFFNMKRVFSDDYRDPTLNPTPYEIRDLLQDIDADILCFQEFYDDKNSEIFNNVEKITKIGNYENYFVFKQKHKNGTRRGLITFSKYPIINSGKIFISDNNYNGAIFTDVKINNDTLRVINAHFESMRLNTKVNYVKSMLVTYKNGTILHNKQSNKLMTVVMNSPYKTIICGDFNEVPYSYVYNQIKSILYNSFENAGEGFGFSYNGNIISFLRIDNQFYDPRIKILNFETIYDCKASKHFPILGKYLLN